MRNNLGGLRPGVNWEKEEKKKRLRVLSAGNNYDKAMKSRRLNRRLPNGKDHWRRLLKRPHN